MTGSSGRRIAYLFPLFPVINQTFTLAEVVWLKQRGYDIRVYSLMSGVDPEVQQGEARGLIDQTHYCPGYTSPRLWKPMLRALVRDPRGVLGLFGAVWSAWRREVPTEARQAGAPGPETFGWKDWIDALHQGSRWFYLVKNWMLVPHALYLAEAFRRDGIRYVHCQWATFPATVAMLVRRWAGIPFSVSAHAYDIHMMPWMLPTKLEESEFFVTCAEYNRRYLRTLCSAEAGSRIVLNYHGTNLARFRPGPRSEGPDFRIVSVGWFKEYKGFHFVVEALSLLVARGVNARLHLAGDGPQKGWLQEQARRLGLEERVVFHGFLDHDRLVALYRDCDVLAMGSIEMPSFGRQDVIPNVIAEAMAVGLPVVATKMGGIAELVEDGRSGILVPQRDAAAMAEALGRIAADVVLAAELRAGALARVAQIWDRDRNLQALARIFDEKVPAPGHATAA